MEQKKAAALMKEYQDNKKSDFIWRRKAFLFASGMFPDGKYFFQRRSPCLDGRCRAGLAIKHSIHMPGLVPGTNPDFFSTCVFCRTHSPCVMVYCL